MSSKNITFNLESSENENIKNLKSLVLLDKEKSQSKRRNSKNTLSSLEGISTKFSINNKLRRRPRYSILSSEMQLLKENENNIRIDAFGNEIKKGEKNYKVSFIDQISSDKIAEIILIETNEIIIKNKKNNDEKDYCKCNTCFIF